MIILPAIEIGDLITLVYLTFTFVYLTFTFVYFKLALVAGEKKYAEQKVKRP